MYIGDNKLVITIEDKTFQSDLPKNVGINLKYEVSALHTIKHDIRELLSKYEQGNEKKNMDTKNSKTNEPHKFVLNMLPIRSKKFE